MDMISENIYIGSIQAAENSAALEIYGIKAILNATEEYDTRVENIEYLQLPLKDEVEFPISEYI